jgi:hypothetical protein
LQGDWRLPLVLLVAELAANAVGAEPVFPKTIASFLAEAFAGLNSHQFVRAVCEAALAAVWTTALF